MKPLDHKNIVEMIALYSNKRKATLYFVMEFCKGQSLMEYIREKGALPKLKALDFFK